MEELPRNHSLQVHRHAAAIGQVWTRHYHGCPTAFIALSVHCLCSWPSTDTRKSIPKNLRSAMDFRGMPSHQHRAGVTHTVCTWAHTHPHTQTLFKVPISRVTFSRAKGNGK